MFYIIQDEAITIVYRRISSKVSYYTKFHGPTLNATGVTSTPEVRTAGMFML